MSMTYTSYVTTMQTMLVVYDNTGQANLNAILPNMIDYAELRLYRDLDLLNTVTSASGPLTSGNRNITLPTPTGGVFVVIESANLITPAGETNPDAGTRVPLQRVSKEYLNFMFGAASAGQPGWFVDFDNATAMVGPKPDAAYTVEFLGTYRPASLSVSNPTTLLTAYFPDLFVSASMIFGAGYQRDFGQQADDPRMAMSWETQYQAQLKSAMVEEFRKKAKSQGWQAFLPTPASPPLQ